MVIIAGTSPEIIKLAEFTEKMKKKFGEEFSFLYTGQHFSTNMKDIFFDELGVVPDYDLKCDTSDVASIANQLLPFLRKIHPEYVIVYGDTYSTMAGALVSLKMRNVRLIHLETG